MAKKPVITAKEAAAMIPDGATIMCGGFLACGQARAIVKELVARGTKDLTLIANDMARAVGPKGEEFFGIAELIHNHQVKRVIATHVGMTPEVGQQNTEGTLEVNLLPQGTLAECIRAGGAGLGGVLTPVGVDTLVEDSPFCLGRQTIDGKDYLLMKPIHADFALLGTYKCDEYGNCWYKGTMRNFNVVMATAADTVIAETEYLVPGRDLDLPGERLFPGGSGDPLHRPARLLGMGALCPHRRAAGLDEWLHRRQLPSEQRRHAGRSLHRSAQADGL